MSHLDFREKVFHDLLSLDNIPKILTAINSIFSEFGDRASVQEAKESFLAEGADYEGTTDNSGRDFSNLFNNREVYVTDNLITKFKGNNAADDGLTYEIKGATISGGVFTHVTQTVVNAGYSEVPLGTPLARVFSNENISSTDAVSYSILVEDGVTYVSTTPIEADYDKVHFRSVSKTTEYKNKGTKASYTVPDGYYAIIKDIYGGIARSNGTAGTLYLNIRKPGEVFINVQTTVSGNSKTVSSQLDNYIIVEPNSDIELVSDTTNAGCDSIGGFFGVLAKII